MRPGERETCLRVLRENLAEVDYLLSVCATTANAYNQALYEHRGAIEKALHVLERSGGAP